MAKQPKRTNQRQVKRGPDRTQKILLIAIAVLLALLLGLVVLLLAGPGRQEATPPAAADGWYDPAAKVGNLPGRSKEEIQKELDKIVEEGMFNISIASIIAFSDGESEGEARIENIAANPYNMTVTITLDEGDELVYESKGLAPGQFIENIRLNRDLPAGEYKATALFTAYTKEDLLKVGQAAAKITIYVEK